MCAQCDSMSALNQPACAMEGSFILPRVMIAALHGRSGKTVIVAGILRALKNRGIDVQPFKKGPDYIDPGWHSAAAGRNSRNLDCFFMDAAAIKAVMHDASKGARLALVEGAMGLYDGSDVAGSSSSAEVAKQTTTPVILVIDVTRMTRTTAALVLGCMDFDPDVHIAGVILNRIRGKRHEKQIRLAIEEYCGIPVLGAIPENDLLALSDRHLGLVTSVEAGDSNEFLNGVAALMEEHCDIDAIVRIADDTSALQYAPLPQPARIAGEDAVKIAVVRDRAFHFYYAENLQALQQAGAELVYVDSMTDTELPKDICGLYVGGGFPEVFAQQLQENTSFRNSVKTSIDNGIACCAECGGLMYLARTLRTGDSAFEMVGAFDVDIQMETERQGHGYAVVEATGNHPWLAAGSILLGHEHHHSHTVGKSDDMSFAYRNQRGRGISDKMDGLCVKRTVASYLHVNAIASPAWAEGFVSAAVDYREHQP